MGDWGTQFGMLIEYMKETYPDFQDEQFVQSCLSPEIVSLHTLCWKDHLPEVRDLQEFYKVFSFLLRCNFDQNLSNQTSWLR